MIDESVKIMKKRQQTILKNGTEYKILTRLKMQATII